MLTIAEAVKPRLSL